VDVLRETDVNEKWEVGFEVLTVVSMKMAVFWVVAPCSLVKVYQCFRGPYCLQNFYTTFHYYLNIACPTVRKIFNMSNNKWINEEIIAAK
jgi:hypothetical protein